MTLLGKDIFVLNLGNSLGLEKDNPQVGFFNNLVGDNSPFLSVQVSGGFFIFRFGQPS